MNSLLIETLITIRHTIENNEYNSTIDSFDIGGMQSEMRKAYNRVHRVTYIVRVIYNRDNNYK